MGAAGQLFWRLPVPPTPRFRADRVHIRFVEMFPGRLASPPFHLLTEDPKQEPGTGHRVPRVAGPGRRGGTSVF